jgi:hypothetical protein
VLELLLNGAAETPATPSQKRNTKRRRGWPKGKPRGRQALSPKARAAAAIAAHPEKTNRAIAEEIGVSAQTVMRARHQMKNGGNDNAPQKRRGKPRRPPIAVKGREPGRRRKASKPETAAEAEARRAVRRARYAEVAQARRAAKAKRAAAKAKTGSNGNGNAEITAAQALWQHAEQLAPKTPWRAIAREFGTNEAQAQNCYRNRTLPPGMTASAVERFLELAPPRLAPPMAAHS